ncbi:MFS transporter [Bradyrhizobium sp. CCBAU 11386]|uniref:MFS transporter n=1 Tax=Bradyrhizobium sp. CCBAU 11386 TaxID=1630837 RepID=UPI00230212D9|nr:MFS transporter [Bradyrhizobium sp. CCBAU 11386]
MPQSWNRAVGNLAKFGSFGGSFRKSSCKATDKAPVRIPAPIAYIVLYVALYAAFGAASPFWPKFFETRALASQQIGLILAAAMLTRLVSGPMVARLADQPGSLRLVLAGCAAVAASAAVAMLWADRFWWLLLVALVQAAALAPTTPIADALSVNTARPRFAGRPFEYGWIRGAASAAFVLGTLVSGQLVSPADLTPVIWMNAVFLIAATGATALLPGQARSQRSPSFAVSGLKL